MGKELSRLATAEEVDFACHLRLTLRVEPKVGVSIAEVAENIAALLSSPESAGLQTRIVEEPSSGRIILAIPGEFSKPELGVSQLLNLLTVPTEYDHCNSIVFENLELPKSHLKGYGGPRLGASGIRQAFGVSEGPILGAILKPRLMRNLDHVVETVSKLASAGLDFLVDDELMVDTVDAPFEERVGRVIQALEGNPCSDGRTTRFVANVTARPSQAAKFAEAARSLGAGGLVTNPIVVGFGALEDLGAADHNLPIFATNMGAALLAKGPETGRFAGFTEAFVGKLARLAGADAIHGGIDKSDWYAATPSLGTINMLGGTLDVIKPAFRVVAGGLDVLKMIDNWPLNGEPVIFAAGSSVFTHPQGARAGAAAMRAAWHIACEHMTTEESSRNSAKAAVLLASEKDQTLAGAINAAGWQPSAEVRSAMRKPSAKKPSRISSFFKGLAQ